MDFLFEVMDESATFLVETPFVALSLVILLSLVCWMGAFACDKGQEMGQ